MSRRAEGEEARRRGESGGGHGARALLGKEPKQLTGVGRRGPPLPPAAFSRREAEGKKPSAAHEASTRRR